MLDTKGAGVVEGEAMPGAGEGWAVVEGVIRTEVLVVLVEVCCFDACLVSV